MPLKVVDRYWKDLSVSKKLYAVVGLMVFLITTELFTMKYTVNILSAVRAFVGGEGLWSKAQKNALLEIQNYIIFRDEKYHRAFLEQLAVPMGDREARLELMRPNPDR
ncbi:MAG: response regulator, partial [Pseudobdellovibrio sp.]